MTAASEARRIALMLNDSKWQEIEEEIILALKAARFEGMLDAEVEYCDGKLRPKHGMHPSEIWRDQPDGVR